MIRYQKIHNVNLGSTNALPGVPISPEGQAMGSVPGWSILFDPAYMVSGSPRNRARPNNIMSMIAGGFTADQFDNGAPAALMTSDTRVQPNLTINNEAWSAFCVTELVADSEVPEFMSSLSRPSGLLSIRNGFNIVLDSITYYEGGSTTSRARYSLPSGDFAGETVLVTWTFSTRDGIRIYLNGELVDHNGDDKRPYDVGYHAGEWIMFRGFRGKVGMCGLLDIDLGWPEHAGHRRAIEKFLMSKYNIPEGPQ